MSLQKRGAMIILSSPSGAGKTTLVKLISKNKKYFTSISHTTRTPRLNEIDGIDYFFIGRKEFQNLINENEFLEYAKVFENYYGTPKKSIIGKLDEGKNVIFDIDWQGTEQIIKRNLNYKLISIFILPPSKKVLHERLSNRDMKDKLIVEERMKQFDKDILHWVNYNYVVINDDLKSCYDKIVSILDNELNNKKNNYDKVFIEKHIKKLL
mgnify:FL=1|tara:strand:+ start:5 stop:634 length:630 start_codon:yes stop_codon:yes gene_type:complete